ncbi:MAG: ABC transporter ATP-binding protein [Desulfobacterota bacterium]|nr:ABC transporter ATP-binding protein [Thermodesulfobacteriota bacterium]
MNACLLEVKNLCTILQSDSGIARVVDNVSFQVHSGETLALVGESGCGKTMTAFSLMRLLPSPPCIIAGGTALLGGEDLLTLPEKKMRQIRGNRIAMVFQEPLTSLNPVFRIGDQIAEVLHVHRGMNKKDARERAVELLRDVGIPSPESRIFSYPHQLSGGMRQRVMIAMALACDPALLIADEPTTALDVTVQAQIMELFQSLQRRKTMGILLITHDLGIVAETAHTVAVMYAGTIVEYTDVMSLFRRPLHPYTQGLLDSLPRPEVKRLRPIPGMVPPLDNLPNGCRFHTRCSFADKRCREQEPELLPFSGNSAQQIHLVRCWQYDAHMSAANIPVSSS